MRYHNPCYGELGEAGSPADGDGRGDFGDKLGKAVGGVDEEDTKPLIKGAGKADKPDHSPPLLVRQGAVMNDYDVPPGGIQAPPRRPRDEGAIGGSGSNEKDVLLRGSLCDGPDSDGSDVENFYDEVGPPSSNFLAAPYDVPPRKRRCDDLVQNPYANSAQEDNLYESMENLRAEILKGKTDEVESHYVNGSHSTCVESDESGLDEKSGAVGGDKIETTQYDIVKKKISTEYVDMEKPHKC